MPSLEKDLDHSRAAYLFAMDALPPSAPRTLNGWTFRANHEITAMKIELGWAFYCRYESCFEVFLKKSNIILTKKYQLSDWFAEKGIETPAWVSEGLSIYRRIRNQLHHENGASFVGAQDQEIQMLQEHLEKFYKMFVWCASEIDGSSNVATQTDG